MARPKFTAPGLDNKTAETLINALSERLVSLIDLSLTLKHVHWNVVGPQFIAVHEMLDPQVDAVRLMSDVTAERIATLGGTPVGTPGHLVETRSWDDYAIQKATVEVHLAALDAVYTGIIEDHRKVEAKVAELDPVTDDMLIAQLAQLEQFQWFIRAHLENSAGELMSDAELEAATKDEGAVA